MSAVTGDFGISISPVRRFWHFDTWRRIRDNEDMVERARKRLRKRAKRGLRGYPVATVALYGPDDIRATKLAVGIVPAEDADVTDLRRWSSTRGLGRVP